jgi:hypothetical protein
MLKIFSTAKVQKNIDIFTKNDFFFACLNKNDYLCSKNP